MPFNATLIALALTLAACGGAPPAADPVESPAAEVERLRGFGSDLEAASGRDHHRIAVPSVFFVDSSRVVRWSHADLNDKV